MVKNGENNGGWKFAKNNSANLYLFTDETTGDDRPATRAEHNMSTIQWRHVAAVHGYQGSKQRLYVDGVLVSDTTRGGKIESSNGRVLAFSARDNGTTNGSINANNHAKVHIDDVRIYNRALESYEIAAMSIQSNKLVAYVDTPYSYQIPATQGPTSWSTAGNNLSSRGLTLNSSTGVITGTPNAAGDFNASITATNSEGSDTKFYNFTVKKGNRSLSWDQIIAGKTYGDANFTLSASSPNAGGITYGSSDESILEINGTPKDPTHPREWFSLVLELRQRHQRIHRGDRPDRRTQRNQGQRSHRDREKIWQCSPIFGKQCKQPGTVRFGFTK